MHSRLTSRASNRDFVADHSGFMRGGSDKTQLSKGSTRRNGANCLEVTFIQLWIDPRP
jgi:hypothetical protein